MLLTCLLSAAALAPPPPDGLDAKARAELRALLAEALAAPDAKARARAVAGARRFAEADFVELVEALRAGPALPDDALGSRPGEAHSEHGSTTVGFELEHDGARYRYALDLPRKYDPARPAPLLLDPGHGSAQGGDDATRAEMLSMYRRHADAAGLSGWILARTEIVEQIGAGGARGALPEDEVAEVFGAFFRDLATRVAFDPDRVYCTGLSQTGYWTWYLARSRADRFAGIAPMSAITRLEADAYLANLVNLPVYVLHGSDDGTTGVAEVRATCARLAALGFEHVYREVPDAGHDYATWGQQPEALEWLAARPRARYPRVVSKSLQTLRDPWCHWLRVEAIAREGDGRAATAPTAGVDAELDGQTVRIRSDGVERLSLFLASEMLDLERPVEVLWNGESVHSGPVARDVEVLVGAAAEKVDWSATFEARLELRAPRAGR